MTAFVSLRQLLNPRPFQRLKGYLARQRNHAVQTQIRSATGLTPTNEFEEDDVFIVGYPKSGNTWFQNLVAGVVYGLNPRYAPFTLVVDTIPRLGQPFYKRYSTPMFFKSHHLPRSAYHRVVYLVRDGRDVMVSYFHHLSALGKASDFLELIQNERIYPCKWHQHVEAWLSTKNDIQMITIRYEDLLEDPVKELKRFCLFVGIERADSFLEIIAEGASFANMQQKELTLGHHRADWPKDRLFVRRGQVGSHIDEMPSHVLEVFVAEAGETLHKLGYS